MECMVPVSKQWVVKDTEYEWEFGEKIWVSPSSRHWEDSTNAMEKGHMLVCVVIRTMGEEEFHPVLSLNLPPPNFKKGDDTEPTKNLCSFFFASDDIHPNSVIYPKSTDGDAK